MKIGKHAQYRHFFDHNLEFPDELKLILDGYNEAALKAAKTAKLAISTGTLQHIREAQWWEAVAQTIEECLNVAIDDEDYFHMPTAPEFDV